MDIVLVYLEFEERIINFIYCCTERNVLYVTDSMFTCEEWTQHLKEINSHIMSNFTNLNNLEYIQIKRT